jgi:hypothetical protein
MLYVDSPTVAGLRTLAAFRADACLSICVPITPLTHERPDSRITGRVTSGDGEPARSYGVVEEIARGCLFTGARVLGGRLNEILGGADLAATLRYAL